ncbi:hypothetical protein PR003_g26404 [Phytophthora rubi]|uniref:Uncharacterized protein n=1 Tax=Phytophthora rubi TaxID=129364 RepID=A0A6A3K9F3_9STRA|nr:hypothetical protein PR001_g17814 [Phytophthora rubi]KAE9286121.1 hypothetical protein PR003_g26404 [Phytophthora rubi]
MVDAARKWLSQLKVTNAVSDSHHKFLQPSFETSLAVRRYDSYYEEEMAADGTPKSDAASSSFSELLKYKTKRVGGRLEVGHLRGGKTCSSCGKNIGGSEVHRCAFCGADMDLNQRRQEHHHQERRDAVLGLKPKRCCLHRSVLNGVKGPGAGVTRTEELSTSECDDLHSYETGPSRYPSKLQL